MAAGITNDQIEQALEDAISGINVRNTRRGISITAKKSRRTWVMAAFVQPYDALEIVLITLGARRIADGDDPGDAWERIG